jgi:hypothetical protein
MTTKCKHQERWEESEFFDGSPFTCMWCFDKEQESLYYEIHVTLAPDFDRLEEVKFLGKKHSFHMGKLLLMKKEDQLSHKDMFLTGRSHGYYEACKMTQELITDLQFAGFKILRYKIEDTVLDSKIHDKFGVLNDNLVSNS